MKISKTSWLILGAGIFVIAFASLGLINSQRLQEQSQLNEELSLAKIRLDKLQSEELASDKESLEMQLEQTISQFEAAKATLSQPNLAIDVSDNLYSIAEACDVEISEISSTGLMNDDLENITTSALPFSTTVNGNVSNLINFVAKLNSDFVTGVVKSVQITTSNAVSDNGSSANTTSDNISSANTTSDNGSSANIRLIVYSYEGD